MRYVILDKEHGVFLGTHSTKAFDQKGSVLALWSKRNLFSLSKAYSFESKMEAYLYLENYLYDFPDAFVTSINSDEKYIDVVDLIKAGLSNFTHDMIDGLHMPNDHIH